MARKDLRSLTTDLAALASDLPTQKTPSPRPAKPETPSATAPSGEQVIQFNLSLRKSQRKQLARLADDADMTMRAFVLNALKEKGLDVRPEDVVDRRKQRG